jgi:hypothetical protein
MHARVRELTCVNPAAAARPDNASMANPADQPAAQAAESFRDFYTRKVGGERYEYEAAYVPGERVQWHARVFRDGAPRGTTGGTLRGNRLQGQALRQQVATLVEVAIEGLQGIHEQAERGA